MTDEKVIELCKWTAELVESMRAARDARNKQAFEMMKESNTKLLEGEDEVWIPRGYAFVANGIEFEFTYDVCKWDTLPFINVKGSPSCFSVDIEFLKYLGVL